MDAETGGDDDRAIAQRTTEIAQRTTEVERLISACDTVVARLEAILAEQEAALAAPQAEVLQALAAQQTEAIERLRRVHKRRADWLARAAAEGFAADSLSDWLRRWAGEDGRRSLESAEALKHRIGRVRRQTWRQWIAVQGAHRHVSSLLQLISQGGQQEIAYGQQSTPGRGGAILNASA